MKFKPMNIRIAISLIIISLGALLALLPQNEGERFRAEPDVLAKKLADTELSLTPDQVARMLSAGDTTLLFVDVRSPEEFRKVSLPGAINIPVDVLVKGDPALLLPDDRKIIFFSNDDIKSNMALAFSYGFNCTNIVALEGGMNSWFETIVNSSFSGEIISARENALFESRFKAKRLFHEYNSLPDSLKLAMATSGFGKKVKLDGGCE